MSLDIQVNEFNEKKERKRYKKTLKKIDKRFSSVLGQVQEDLQPLQRELVKEVNAILNHYNHDYDRYRVNMEQEVNAAAHTFTNSIADYIADTTGDITMRTQYLNRVNNPLVTYGEVMYCLGSVVLEEFSAEYPEIDEIYTYYVERKADALTRFEIQEARDAYTRTIGTIGSGLVGGMGVGLVLSTAFGPFGIIAGAIIGVLSGYGANSLLRSKQIRKDMKQIKKETLNDIIRTYTGS